MFIIFLLHSICYTITICTNIKERKIPNHISRSFMFAMCYYTIPFIFSIHVYISAGVPKAPALVTTGRFCHGPPRSLL